MRAELKPMKTFKFFKFCSNLKHPSHQTRVSLLQLATTRTLLRVRLKSRHAADQSRLPGHRHCDGVHTRECAAHACWQLGLGETFQVRLGEIFFVRMCIVKDNFKIFKPFTVALARAAFANRFIFQFPSYSTMAENVTDTTIKDAPEEKWETLIEGKAKILHRPGEAFYNPAQVARQTQILITLLLLYSTGKRLCIVIRNLIRIYGGF